MNNIPNKAKKEKRENSFHKIITGLMILLAVSYIIAAVWQTLQILKIVDGLPTDPISLVTEYMMSAFFLLVALALTNKKINALFKSTFEKAAIIAEED